MYIQKTNWNNWNWNAQSYSDSSKRLIYNRIRYQKQAAPKMPTLGKGYECSKFLLSQASKGMREALFRWLYLQFLLIRLMWNSCIQTTNYYELCQMGH